MRAMAALALAVVFAAWPARAVGNPPVGDQRWGGEGPTLGLTLLGGLAVPLCRDQLGCSGSLAAGPSLEGLILYAPSDAWCFGLVAEVRRGHWHDTYQGMVEGGKTYAVDSDLTSGFAGVAARYVALPALRVAPVIQVAIGSGFQMQTGNNFHCTNGVMPTGQIAVGGRARASKLISIFALASASSGFTLSNCGVSDGPAATPFAGWGVGLQAGAAVDVPL